MTPGTRLLEALTAWIDAPDRFARDGLEADVIDAFGAVSTARALYPAAHAIGDRVSVVYPDERKPDYEDFAGTVVGVEFTDTGVDYRVKGDGDPDYTVVEAGFVRGVPAVDARLVANERPPYVVTEVNTSSPDDRERIVWQQTVKPIAIPEHELKPGHLTSDEANALMRRAMLDSYGPRDSSVSVADEARAFDPFDESFTDEARIGGERALNLFADMLDARSETYSAPLTPDMPVTSTNTAVIPGRVLVQTHTDEHGVRSVATQPLCPSRSGGQTSFMCEGLADHAGPHHALAGTVTW